MQNKPYVDCLSHPVILGLLSSEAFVGSVASISQPSLLLKALNALLSLLWNGQAHSHTEMPPQAVLKNKGNLINQMQDAFHHSYLHVVMSRERQQDEAKEIL